MMTMRGAMYFLIAFLTVVVLGVLSGCSSDDFHSKYQSRAYGYVAYCGMERCDGKRNR